MDGTRYRPSRPLMLASIVLAILFGCLALVCLVLLFVTLFRGDFGDSAFAGFDVLAVGAFAALMWRQSRIQVVVQDTGLYVVNYLSTLRVPWDSIERFDSSFKYCGIAVMMKDGRIIRCSASSWLNTFSPE
jgi:hypothetical protein